MALNNRDEGDPIDTANKILTDSYHELAGGADECKQIFAWMKENPGIREVAEHAKGFEGSFSFLIQETRFALVINLILYCFFLQYIYLRLLYSMKSKHAK